MAVSILSTWQETLLPRGTNRLLWFRMEYLHLLLLTPFGSRQKNGTKEDTTPSWCVNVLSTCASCK
ncbi:TPA: hypothetical protein N0F65_005487 [Lagenidium giganteum]|uniref:Uncharacterized protein n=1 Tax=Lagenidium giganteum TaxID=4803 RepID=A0AAV2YIP6_9STRA|nr:TPA: hypothetical protein N0F65_005487 [Lagenidium giganteum]